MRFFRIDDQNPLTGWHMLAIVCLFFGVIIAVNIAMAVVAVGSFPGLIVKNSYVASQRYNALLEEAGAQDRRGWTGIVTADGGIVSLTLADASGAPVRQLAVSATAGRPASRREDRTLVLEPTAAGYAAAEPLPGGRWLVELSARDGNALVYRRTQELYVSGGAQ